MRLLIPERTRGERSGIPSLTVVEDHPMQIRPATADAALRLSILAAHVFVDTYAFDGIHESIALEIDALLSRTAFERHMLDAATTVLVAEIRGHLVGYIHATRGTRHAMVDARVPVEVVRLYVQPRFARQGIGSALMERVEAAECSAGADVAWLTAWSGNHRALEFYARRGYVDRGAVVYSFQGEDYENRLFVKALVAHHPSAAP